MTMHKLIVGILFILYSITVDSLFKLLAKKHQKISERLNGNPSTPTTSSPAHGGPDYVSPAASVLSLWIYFVLTHMIYSCLVYYKTIILVCYVVVPLQLHKNLNACDFV